MLSLSLSLFFSFRSDDIELDFKEISYLVSYYIVFLVLRKIQDWTFFKIKLYSKEKINF